MLPALPRGRSASLTVRLTLQQALRYPRGASRGEPRSRAALLCRTERTALLSHWSGNPLAPSMKGREPVAQPVEQRTSIRNRIRKPLDFLGFCISGVSICPSLTLSAGVIGCRNRATPESGRRVPLSCPILRARFVGIKLIMHGSPPSFGPQIALSGPAAASGPRACLGRPPPLNAILNARRPDTIVPLRLSAFLREGSTGQSIRTESPDED
jgi:hypothetical protein